MLKVEYINPKYAQELKKAGVVCEEAVLNWTCGEVAASKTNSKLYRCQLPDIGVVYVKLYFPHVKKRLAVIRKSNAVREFTGSLKMKRIGITQAEPVFCGVVKSKLGLVRCGMYIMREVENSISLEQMLEQMKANPDNTLLEQISKKLLFTLRKMHESNFCHSDFKPRNILLKKLDTDIDIVPIDCRSPKKIHFFNKRRLIEKDYKFLLREKLLLPYFENREAK